MERARFFRVTPTPADGGGWTAGEDDAAGIFFRMNAVRFVDDSLVRGTLWTISRVPRGLIRDSTNGIT